MKEIIKKEKRIGINMKRILSVVLVLVMVLTLLPMNTLKVYAQGGVCKIGETEYLTVERALKGAANNANTVPSGETAENPTVITMIDNSTERITIPAGRNITLDLNGYVLNGGGNITLDPNGYVQTGGGNGIVITNKGTLTIKDSNTANQTHNFKVDSNGFWTLTNDAKTVDYDNIVTYPTTGGIVALKGGCITGGINDAGSVSAGVVVDGGTLTLNSGSIVGNYCGAGPGVTVKTNGVFNMTGGTITGNMANTSAAGIVIAGGTVNLSGGDVSYNVANATGNGIMVNGSSGLVSVLNMTGGRIIGNHTHFVTYWPGERNYDYGGGVAIYNAGKMIMTGGTITKNNSKDKGGGVGFEGTGGQLTLGGSASITGNTKKDGTTASNLYLPSGTTVKVSEEAPLASGSTINVTTQSVPSKGNPVAITSPGTADNSSFFTFSPDNSNYKIYNKIDNNNKQYVVLSVHEHNWSYKAEGNVIKAYCTEEFGTANCDYFGEDNAATITLTATSPTYSGSAITKTSLFSGMDFSAFNTATGKSLSTSDIKLYAASDTSKTSNLSEVTAAGSYVADLTVEGKTATCNVTVNSSSTTYTVSFDNNGGSGTMSDVTGVSGSYSLPPCTFTAPEGKAFKGWSTSDSGDIISETIDITENTTLYAIWKVAGEGSIEKEGQRGSSIETDKNTLIDSISSSQITEADRSKDIKVVLEIGDEEEPAGAIKEKAEADYSEYNIGKAFEMDMILYIDTVKKGSVSLTSPVSISVPIPDSIWSSDMEYQLLHNHGGAVTAISGSASNKKFTFNIAGFSKFAFIYKPKSGEDNTNKEEEKEEEHCNHDYNWEVMEETTVLEDGLLGEKCSKCGNLRQTRNMSSYKYACDEAIKQVKAAPLNSEQYIDMGGYDGYPKALLSEIATRADLTVHLQYIRKDKVFERVIKAGDKMPDVIPEYAGRGFLDAYFAEKQIGENYLERKPISQCSHHYVWAISDTGDGNIIEKCSKCGHKR